MKIAIDEEKVEKMAMKHSWLMILIDTGDIVNIHFKKKHEEFLNEIIDALGGMKFQHCSF